MTRHLHAVPEPARARCTVCGAWLDCAVALATGLCSRLDATHQAVKVPHIPPPLPRTQHGRGLRALTA